jgi:hypothetical protein
MNTLELLSMDSPDPSGTVSRKHDASPVDRQRHIQLAISRYVGKMSVAECQRLYGLASRMSVHRYIGYALSYQDEEQSDMLRRIVAQTSKVKAKRHDARPMERRKSA